MATVGTAPKTSFLGQASNVAGNIPVIGQAIGTVTGIIGSLTGPKPHDMAPEIPDSGPYYGVKNAFPGLSDDPSWPIHNRFVQAKELDGGKSWSADNKKSWLWLYTNPDGPFSIEDKSPSNVQAFVNRVKALYAAGKVPADYPLSREYKEKVVLGRDLSFGFLDDYATGKTTPPGSGAGSGAVALAGFGSGGLLVGAIAVGALLLFGRKG